MRIAIATWSARRIGGAESYLAALLPALTAAGHEVLLFAERDTPDARDPISPDVPPLLAGDGDAAAAVEALAAWKPDVVYAHGLESPAIEEALLDTGIPAVFFAHGYYGTCIAGSRTLRWPDVRPCDYRFGPACLARYFPRRIGGRSPVTMLREYRRQRRRLDLLSAYRFIVTHSDHMRREFVRHGQAAARVRAIPFLVPIPDEPPASRARAGGPWHLLFVGRMDRVKGGHVLIDTLPLLVDRSPGLHATFVGDGPQLTAWRARAAERVGGDGRVTTMFEGWQTGATLDRAYAHADLLVVPSLWPEPFGRVGPEAGARGVPAAAFDVGGVRSWLTPGVTGHLAPADPPTASGLAEAIARSLSDPEHYANLSTGAADGARRFTTEQHLRHLLPLLADAAG